MDLNDLVYLCVRDRGRQKDCLDHAHIYQPTSDLILRYL